TVGVRHDAHDHVAVGLEYATVGHGELHQHAHLFGGGEDLPGEDEEVAGGEEAAPPRAAQLLGGHRPGAERVLESFGRNLQRVNLDAPGGFHGVAVEVARLDDDLQALVAGQTVLVESAGLPAELDRLDGSSRGGRTGASSLGDGWAEADGLQVAQ